MNLFLYWGGNKLSYLRLLTIKTFKICNPDFKINLVIPSKASNKIEWVSIEHTNVYDGKDFIDEAKECSDNVIYFNMEDIGLSNDLPEVYKSDIVRNYLLVTYGGIWSDFDIIYFKPVPTDLIDVDFLCYNTREIYYSIGFIGSTKGSSFYNNILNTQLTLSNNSIHYQKFGSDILNGQIIKDIKNIPMNLVYYFDCRKINDIFNSSSNLPEESIGIHWYAGSPITREWEHRYNSTDYDSFNNILSIKLKEIYGNSFK